ncbi:hypothetical protein FQZ97_1023780 [compost metagenome]
MLQGAGAMEGQAQVATQAQAFQGRVAQHFHQVSGQFADPSSLVDVARVVLKQVTVVLYESTAATGGLDDRLGTGLDGRPPGIDIAPGTIQSGLLGIEVIVHRAAAAGFASPFRADTQAIQHPRRGGIGVG